MVMAVQETRIEKTASAIPPLRSPFSPPTKKYGEKKWDALARPLTRESAAARLTLGRGMVEVTQAKDTVDGDHEPLYQASRTQR